MPSLSWVNMNTPESELEHQSELFLRTHAHIAHADAGTEWGVGALDAKRFYKAPLPDAVRARSMRQKRESSTFLELYNLLVTARILGPHWTGSHVRIKVDKAFKEYLRRSLPHRSRQKAGVNATLMTTMVGMIRRRFGHGSAQEALVLLMWAGLLRPGEAVTTPKYPQYDIT